MSEKPILYSFWRSSCAWRVRTVLALKNIEYEYRAIDLFNSGQKIPEYQAISPFGMVPCLVVNGQPIVESMAIIEYLEEKFPHTQKLFPENPEDKAKTRAIAYMITSNIQPLQAIRVVDYHGQGDNAKSNAWAKHFIQVGFEALEKMLQKTAGKYAVGDMITIADVCIPPQVFNAKLFNIDMSKYPTLERINNTLVEIPEFQKAHPHNQPDTPPKDSVLMKQMMPK